MIEGELLGQVDLLFTPGVIVAGVRVAPITTIGTATIAAAIGAGGPGVFISSRQGTRLTFERVARGSTHCLCLSNRSRRGKSFLCRLP